MSEPLEPGIGRLLATARQVKGLSTSDVADKLKLTSRQIEALEAEEYDKLPAAVFVRGFIRNYARLVGLDAEQLLANLGEMQGATQNITVPSEGVAISSSPLKRWMIYLAGGLVLFLLLVALLYQWLSQGEQVLVAEPAAPSPTPEITSAPPAQDASMLPGSTVTAPTTPPAMIGPAAAPPMAPANPVAPANPPIAAVAPVMVPKPASVVPATPTTTNPYLAPITPPTPKTEAATPAAKPAGGASTLRFSATEDSWVQVVDGVGKSGSKLIGRGTDAVFSGTPPFRVVVGNAATVKMQYNDQAIDLRPFTGDKVARLTLE